eukprot:scaffold81945_cov63-Phaeocystis_antarctica.AAC.4
MNSVAAMSCNATINTSRGSPSRCHAWGSISAQDTKRRKYRPQPPPRAQPWPPRLPGRPPALAEQTVVRTPTPLSARPPVYAPRAQLAHARHAP